MLSPKMATAFEAEVLGNSCGGFKFENPQLTNTQGVHSAIAAADFNRDGIPDVVVSIPDFDIVTVFIGNNDGSFQSERNFVAGNGPRGIAVADLNGDGELDLAVASQIDQMVNILNGDGTGNFTASGSYSVSGMPGKLVAGDLNGDGWIDLAISSTDLKILYGSRIGFTPGQNYMLPMPTTNVAAGDFNEDGLTDVAVTFSGESSGGGVRIYLSDEYGVLTESVTVTDSTRIYSLAIADFNADGNLDVIAAGNTTSSLIPANLLVLLGGGDGSFTTLPLNTNVSTSGGIATADLNADGNLDFATASGAIYVGNGDGTFVPNPNGSLFPTVFPSASISIIGVDIAAADFNGDGVTDLAQANSWRARMLTYFGKGEAKYPVPKWAGNSTNRDGVVADFNNDGRKDAAFVQGNGQTQLYLQNANGDFNYTGTPIFQSGTSATSSILTIVSADFNGDGNADLAFTQPVLNGLIILLGDGAGNFTLRIIG